MKPDRIRTLLVSLILPMLCFGASPKRGICWEEGKVNLNDHHASLLSPGVSWVYNWGPSAANSEVYSGSFCFVPMAWNGNYNASELHSWLKTHPETKYLLGFNEPNFADQAAMTPAQAATAWPGLEKIAREFDVKLVAPALNFSGSKVGGKVWGIYEWYDEFFRLYPDAQVDFLALHCYMNWYTALNWFATEYFYKDLYNKSNENYGKYPNLVKFMDGYKAKNGHFPKMMLTEFCAWEYDYLPDVYFQIDQMTQKVQKLEQSDLVEGYAWFMGNSGSGASAFPYMSVFQTNSPSSPLSQLGQVYVNMSAFDTSRCYRPSEIIMAKDYINASTDDSQVKVRPNSEPSSNFPLQIEIPAKGKTEYLIYATASDTYMFDFHISNEKTSAITIYVDNVKKAQADADASGGRWRNLQLSTELSEGKHKLMIYNSGSEPVIMNSLTFTSTTGRDPIRPDNSESSGITEIINLNGSKLPTNDLNNLDRGIYIVRKTDGSVSRILR